MRIDIHAHAPGFWGCVVARVAAGKHEPRHACAQRVDDVPVERPGAVRRVVGHRHDRVDGGVGNGEGEWCVAALQALRQLSDLHADDAAEGGVGQRREDDDVVQAVQPLRRKRSAYAPHDVGVDGRRDGRRVSVARGGHGGGFQVHRFRVGQQLLCPDVAREDDDGVAAVNGDAAAVSEAAVIQHLQQNLQHDGRRFFDFVKQDEGKRLRTQGFRQLPALVKPNVPGRGADEATDCVLFRVLGAIDADEVVGAVVQLLRQHFGLTPHPNTTMT